MKNILLKFAGLFVERVPVEPDGAPRPSGQSPSGGSQQQRGAPGAPMAPGAPGMPGAHGMPGQYSAPPGAASMPGTLQPAPGQGMPASAQPLHTQPLTPGPAPGGHQQQPYPGAPGAAYPPHQQPGPGPGPQHQQGMQGVPGAGAPDSTAIPQVGAPPLSVALRAWVPESYASHLAPFGVHVIAAGGGITSEQAQGWGADVLIVSAECLGQDLHLLQQPQLATVFITPQPAMIVEIPGVVQVQEPLRASDVAHAVRSAHADWARTH